MTNECADCGICCCETEMILSARDVARIKKPHPKKLKSIDFYEKTADGLFQLKNVEGYCFFLNPKTNSCEIYTVRPEGCRFYPLIFDPDKKICILDHECPKPELFYPNKNSQLKTCEKIVRFLESEVLFTKLR